MSADDMFSWGNKKKYFVATPSCIRSYVLDHSNRSGIFFRPKNADIFLISPQKRMLWVLITSASLRHF